MCAYSRYWEFLAYSPEVSAHIRLLGLASVFSSVLLSFIRTSLLRTSNRDSTLLAHISKDICVIDLLKSLFDTRTSIYDIYLLLDSIADIVCYLSSPFNTQQL